ncbi:MAG: 2,3-diphosphoglycerate-dependent phosphoglycerate mutase [Akkermansia sp.]
MKTLVLLRHGASVWDEENRLTGWTDVPLSERGRREAALAGRLLRDTGPEFRVAFTSVLSRAIETAAIVLHEMGLSWIPLLKDWRLNAKHEGVLQGVNRAQAAASFGAAQLQRWQRSYDESPPPLPPGDARRCDADPRYVALEPWQLPATESFADVLARMRRCWEEAMAPVLRHRGVLLVVAHDSCLRALLSLVRRLRPTAAVPELPAGLPLVLEFDDDLRELRCTKLAGESLRA